MSFEINDRERERGDLQSRPNAEFAPTLQIIGDYHRSNPFHRKEPFKSTSALPLLGMKERGSLHWDERNP